MASGLKSGAKDSGSVAPVNSASSVIRNEKSHDQEFAKGGNTPMFSEQQASPQTPGQTEKNGATGKGAEFAKGGGGKMFGFQGSVPARDGITSAR
jgi:hypothetical protein